MEKIDFNLFSKFASPGLIKVKNVQVLRICLETRRQCNIDLKILLKCLKKKKQCLQVAPKIDCQ